MCPGISIQTQTRITSKRSKRTQTCPDLCQLNPDVLLSLCGDDVHAFYDQIVTHEQISDDQIGIMGDPRLVVKVGNDFYSWLDSPHEVLLAIAYREFRVTVDEDGERERSVTYGSTEECDDEMNRDKYVKTMRLSSEEISSLELEDGPNYLTFSVTTSLQVQL